MRINAAACIGFASISGPEGRWYSTPSTRCFSTSSLSRLSTPGFQPDGGLTVEVRYTRHIDEDARLLRQQLIFNERDESGRLLRSRTTSLSLRCCSRDYTEEILRACGFEVAALYGGFRGEPVAEGGVQVWVAVREA